ncbi:hypothetical protein D3C87_1513410 [compost metagenome]
MVSGEETRLGKRVPGHLGFGNHLHSLAVEGRFLAVALVVVRGEILRCHLACGVQGRGKHVAIMIGVTRALQQRLGVEQFVQQKAQVAFIE